MVTITTQGILFDLDGTLIESKEGVEKFWHEWAKKHGLSGEDVLNISHGTRTIEVLKHFTPELATEEQVSKLESSIPDDWGQHSVPIPGGKQLIESLPKSQWGIVTSGTNAVASKWLKDFLKFDIPDVFITAETVANGKPDPSGYKLGAKKLNIDNFLVFEDAPAGIKAGKAAGGTVIGLATTYDAERVKSSGADIVIEDLNSVKVVSYNDATKELILEFDPVL